MAFGDFHERRLRVCQLADAPGHKGGVVDEEGFEFLEGDVVVGVVRQVVPVQFADAVQAYQQVGLFDRKA